MFNTEIEVSLKYEQYGIQLLKGRDKMSVLKHFQKGYYLDLSSLATVLNVNMNMMLEDLSYHSAIRGHFVHYRINGKIIKVVDVESLDSMVRYLASAGYDIDTLKAVREQIRKALTEFKKEVDRL